MFSQFPRRSWNVETSHGHCYFPNVSIVDYLKINLICSLNGSSQVSKNLCILYHIRFIPKWCRFKRLLSCQPLCITEWTESLDFQAGGPFERNEPACKPTILKANNNQIHNLCIDVSNVFPYMHSRIECKFTVYIYISSTSSQMIYIYIIVSIIYMYIDWNSQESVVSLCLVLNPDPL